MFSLSWNYIEFLLNDPKDIECNMVYPIFLKYQNHVSPVLHTVDR